jgi:hypothetical protein
MHRTFQTLSMTSISLVAFVGFSITVARSATAADEHSPQGSDSPAVFVRGDVDGSGETNLTDSIALLDFLYRGGNEPGCAAAADANDDELIDLADAVFALSALFLGGETLPAPWPEAGEDPTPGLACAEYDDREAKALPGPVRPDLIVWHATWLSVGSDFYFRVYVKNQGLANAGSFKVAIRSETGALVETITVSGLAKGTTTVLFHKMPFRRCGTLYVRKAIVDSGYTVTESNETNNTATLNYVMGPC